MPAERVAMRQVREIIRLKFSAGVPTREIARRLGIAASTVRETLRRFEGAGLSWPLRHQRVNRARPQLVS
jgi:transposase-like protein